MLKNHAVSVLESFGRMILAMAVLAGAGLLAASAARADVTPADLAGQPAIMKTDCRNQGGHAGRSLCSSDAAYAACVAYLKANHWDYCLRLGQEGSQVRRGTLTDARARLIAGHCTEVATGQFRCPDRDFNLSLAYIDCVGYRNGGGVTTCLRRNFLQEYADRVDTRLKANAPVGYAFVIVNDAGDRVERASGMARRAPDPNPLPMTATSPYPMASVSKNITAAATLRALADRGLSVDTPVWSYLPGDWSYSAAFKNVTFRSLLRHRSGLYDSSGTRCDETQKSVAYDAMRRCVESVKALQFVDSDCDKHPIADTGAIGCYQNLDYAMLRVAIPKLDKRLNAATLEAQIDSTYKAGFGPVLTDPWKQVRENKKAELFADLYQTYVNANILRPAGFLAQCRPTLGAYQPLVYGLTPNAPGTDFGDRSLLCGSEGWVLSARLLATYLHELDAGNVISRDLADQMKSDLFGWEATGKVTTAFGNSQRWWHGGCYNSTATCNLSTMVLSFSNGIQVAAIFNSDFPNGRTYGDDITNAFYDTMAP